MIKWIKIAFRNILKNRRRSFVTIMAIAVGFSAVIFFGGYKESVYSGIRRGAIRGEGLGHLTIYKKGWLEKGYADPEKYMFGKMEIQQIIDITQEEEAVILATPKMDISGLVSNGHTSRIFVGQAVIPSGAKTISGDRVGSRMSNGMDLSDQKKQGVIVAKGLAGKLDLEPGGGAVVMATTLNGQMNLLDIDVAGIYQSRSKANNERGMRFHLAFARSLYDTDKADRIVVLLDGWQKTERVRRQLLKILHEAGLDCEIKTWDTLSRSYSGVKKMFDAIFGFIFIIVFTVVVMSVVNTMGMTVLERTREIGTLRALGLKRRGVAVLFSIEGSMIGFLGSIMGLIIIIIIWALIGIIKPTVIYPGSSSPSPFSVSLLPDLIIQLTLFFTFISLLAAILPARRAARQNIVDALGHV